MSANFCMKGIKNNKKKTIVKPTTVLVSFKKDAKLSLETRSLLKAGDKRPFTRSGFYSLSNHLSGAKVNKNSQTIKLLEKKIKNWDIDDCKLFALLISNLIGAEGNDSKYKIDYSESGEKYTLRISLHNMNASNYAKKGLLKNNYGVTFKEPNTADTFYPYENVSAVEYVYDESTTSKEVLKNIASAILYLLKNGRWDESIAPSDEVNYSPSNKLGQTDKLITDDDYKASKYFGLKVAENKDELERGINEILSQYASREMASNQAINYMDESPEISKEWLRENGLKSRDDFKKWAANRQSKVRKPILEKQEKELMEAKKTIADIHVANILKKAHEEAERWDREHNEDKKENDYFSLSEKLADLYKAGLKLDIQKSKAVAQSMGISITDSELMQACETAVVIEARRIADSEMSIKDKYFKLVDLYGRQVTVQPKDTYAMSLQQYSTPCPIAYLLGVYVNQGLKGGIDEVCYEPTAGNGLLTIALDPKKTVVNELDKVRYENLKRLGFAQVTNYDISKTELAKNSVAGIIMNPPFDSLDKKDFLVRKRMVMGREGVFTFERLDHKIAISVLEIMRDNGRAAIIIGGKMAVKFKDYKDSYWKDGAIYGQYRTFINYLNRQYNVEDVIYLNGDLYRKQGTTFPIVVILINGRTPWNFSREHQWHTFDPVKDSQIDTFNEFFIRMEDHLSLNEKIKVSEDRKRALALLQLAKAKLALAKAMENDSKTSQKEKTYTYRGTQATAEQIMASATGMDYGKLKELIELKDRPQSFFTSEKYLGQFYELLATKDRDKSIMFAEKVTKQNIPIVVAESKFAHLLDNFITDDNKRDEIIRTYQNPFLPAVEIKQY